MTAAFHPVGHLLQTRPDQPPEGQPGTGYNYILAANGLFIQAEHDRLRATIPVAPAPVRGLAPLEPHVELPHGPIPRHLLYRTLSLMRRVAPRELFAAFTWSPETDYALHVPQQDAAPARVTYEPQPDTVLEMHSHGLLNAYFSSQDDSDEQGSPSTASPAASPATSG